MDKYHHSQLLMLLLKLTKYMLIIKNNINFIHFIIYNKEFQIFSLNKKRIKFQYKKLLEKT